MNNMTEELQQELPQEVSEQPEATVDALKEGKLDFFKLPKAEKERLNNEVYENLPDDDAKEAWLMGWRPKELFLGKDKEGNPKPWTDYKEFKQRVESIAPIRNERNRALAKERDTYKEQFEALQKQMKALTEINKSKIERDLLNEEKVLERELLEAREYGDFSKYDEINERKRYVETEKLKLKTFEEPPVRPQEPVIDNDVQDWAVRNSWIVRDKTLMEYATIKDQELKLLHPDLPQAERFDMVTEKVREAFPLRDPSPRRGYEPVKNSAGFSAPKPKTLTFDDLPTDEKVGALKLIRMGIWKDKAEYMKHYKN